MPGDDGSIVSNEQPVDAFAPAETFDQLFTAVDRSVHATVVAVAEQFSRNARVHSVGVRGVDENLDDPLGVLEPHVRPRLAGVGALVDPVADGAAVRIQPLARIAGPHRVRILGIDRECADRLHVLLVEDGLERGAAVHRLPYAAARGANIHGQAVALMYRRERRDATAHDSGADVARAEPGRGFGIDDRGERCARAG